jgi:hypothetical protein
VQPPGARVHPRSQQHHLQHVATADRSHRSCHVIRHMGLSWQNITDNMHTYTPQLFPPLDACCSTRRCCCFMGALSQKPAWTVCLTHLGGGFGWSPRVLSHETQQRIVKKLQARHTAAEDASTFVQTRCTATSARQLASSGWHHASYTWGTMTHISSWYSQPYACSAAAMAPHLPPAVTAAQGPLLPEPPATPRGIREGV